MGVGKVQKGCKDVMLPYGEARKEKGVLFLRIYSFHFEIRFPLSSKGRSKDLPRISSLGFERASLRKGWEA
jgi:hypothetical protein